MGETSPTYCDDFLNHLSFFNGLPFSPSRYSGYDLLWNLLITAHTLSKDYRDQYTPMYKHFHFAATLKTIFEHISDPAEKMHAERLIANFGFKTDGTSIESDHSFYASSSPAPSYGIRIQLGLLGRKASSTFKNLLLQMVEFKTDNNRSASDEARTLLTLFETAQSVVDDAPLGEKDVPDIGRRDVYEKYVNEAPNATVYGPEAEKIPKGFKFGGLIRHENEPRWTNVGRFYVSVRSRYGNDFFEAINGIYQEAKALGYVMQFKVPNNPNDFARADAGVIYFEAAQEVWFYNKIKDVLKQHPEWVRDRGPFFTAPVLDAWKQPIRGLSFAMAPEDGQSFGGKISETIAASCADIRRALQQGEKLTMDDMLNWIALRFERAGIDPTNPAFNIRNNDGRSGREIFPFLLAHTGSSLRRPSDPGSHNPPEPPPPLPAPPSSTPALSPSPKASPGAQGLVGWLTNLFQ